MWYPSDDSFLSLQAQENLARVQMAIASVAANATDTAAANANATSSDSLTNLHDVNPDTLISIGLVAVTLLVWLMLCGICRCYICIPCPCCFCYIPCCCGFCLKDEEKKMPFTSAVYHRHDVSMYPSGAHKNAAISRHHYGNGHEAEVPAYSSLTVDIEEPLLGPPAYSQLSRHNAPPAYHNVPTAPPLS